MTRKPSTRRLKGVSRFLPAFLRKPAIRLQLQTEKTECGIACLTMLANYHGSKVSLEWLRERYPASLRGTGVAKLVDIASELGFAAKIYRALPQVFEKIAEPFIAYLDNSHFVVVHGTRKGGHDVYDPAIGRISVDREEMLARFSGIILRVFPENLVPIERTHTRKGKWRRLREDLLAIRRKYAALVVLTLLSEVLLLVSPIYAKNIFDNVIGHGDLGVINTLFAAFFAFLVIKVIVGCMRSLLLSTIGVQVLKSLSTRLFDKLLKLRAEYFQRRYPGEIISRFGSLHHLQELMSTTLVESFMDALASVLLIGLVMRYDSLLGGVALAGVAGFMALRLAIGNRMEQTSNLLVARMARQDNEIIETIRAVQTIKLNGIENERYRRFLKKLDATNHASLSIQKLAAITTYVGDLIFSGVRLLVLYLGAKRVLDHTISAGTLVAVASYVDMLYQRANSLAPKLLDFKVAGVHLDRISDILDGTSEQSQTSPLHGVNEVCASLAVRDLGYRYSSDEEWIFRNLDLDIRPGEIVAVVGASGLGKSTLLKILSGLMPPIEGTVSMDGVSVKEERIHWYRNQIGSVMQDDALLSGTILENVTLDRYRGDEDFLRQCLRIAQIESFVDEQPMGVHTYVGEMGALLSGGQQQRVLLARALYRRPKVLVLDEATSQLDFETEKEINKGLAGLGMTRVIATHRLNSLPEGTRVIDLMSLMEGDRAWKHCRTS